MYGLCLSDIEVGGQDIMMGHSFRQFEIAVGDVPGWVIETHKALANVVGEHLATQHGLDVGRCWHKCYTSHTNARSVCRFNHRRILWQ